MKRRQFLAAVAGLAVTPLVPVPRTPCDTFPALLYPGESVVRKPRYLSQEELDDMQAWGVGQIDDETRRELLGSDMNVYKHVGVNFLS